MVVKEFPPKLSAEFAILNRQDWKAGAFWCKLTVVGSNPALETESIRQPSECCHLISISMKSSQISCRVKKTLFHLITTIRTDYLETTLDITKIYFGLG